VIATEVRTSSEDVIRKAMSKIINQYLPGVIEEKKRKVNGTPKMHYRINEEALIAKIFPPCASVKIAQMPGSGSQAESILYTDLKNRSLHTDLKTSREEKKSVDNFSEKDEKQENHTPPKNDIPDDGDIEIARWFWSTIVELYERADEYYGTLAKPREPNLNGWANDVQLIRNEHGCSHEQTRSLVERIQLDPFWCPKIQSLRTLRDKWPELALKLCSGNITTRHDPFGASFKTDNEVPGGFRG